MASLDMSLDDMIKSRRNSERGRGQGRARRGRGRGLGGSFRGGRMTVAPRRGPLSVNAGSSSYAIAKSFRRRKSLPWQRDFFEDSLKAAGLSGEENGTKLYVSNLDTGVTNEDIRELFSEFGDLKRHAVHYDRNGCPSGSAEVVFCVRSCAFEALTRYNNVQLDGRAMKIEIIGMNSEMPAFARVNVIGGGRRRRRRAVVIGRGRGARTVNRGSGQRGRPWNVVARGRGRWRKTSSVKKSADELDKELDIYHHMQT